MMLEAKIRDVRSTFDNLARMASEIEQAASSIVQTLRTGGRILVCGNGGSASEGQHFVTELVGRYRSNRQPLPALYLGGDVGQMSCIANDFAWDEVFSRPLQALAEKGDLLLCLSTSGNSPNVVAALDAARRLKLDSIALLGRSGGTAASFARRALVVGSDDTGRIQEAHLFLIHWFCDYVEEAFPMNRRGEAGGALGDGAGEA